ncbi:EscU/YscU/HrcU family type III secretion system export apparatus switch protein [Motilimonas cestriensis]|uniref:EscU/YscU/HrcU family type III secretion system export apparatus switch protein n=1 Tax=Motilimonas cestriensis TaxID=2742685 RepID=A0ABS8W941_9GAMM|nr:EscU/YscU/HrcU family type III secretion system export apparatus switch protein [Motilimonas cestriensis]MCE2595529.1 EscU/YscU/HrcU family type III secretion system export apparatus switch protein [Motilimonas cestriensis]
MKKSIAISYIDKSKSPVVSQKKQADEADALNQAALEAGLIVHQDEHLLSLLDSLEQGDEIPEALYTVIAELISFSYLLQGKFPEHWNHPSEQVDIEI